MWGGIIGALMGCIWLMVLMSADSRQGPARASYVFPVVLIAHLPLIPLLLGHFGNSSYAAAIIPAYWIIIGIGTGLLLVLSKKMGRTITTAIGLALLASVPLGLWSFLLSKRIAQGGVLWIFPDSFVQPLVDACVVLTVLALGYIVFVVGRAFYSKTAKPSHLALACVGWLLATFALNCWVLHGLATQPAWTSVKRDSDDETMVLNSGLTAYAGTVEDRARARAALQQVQMPRSVTALPSLEQKLALALKIEENQHGYLNAVAVRAENAERLTAKRAWISCLTTAFAPVIVVALVAVRKRRQPSGSRQPPAPAP